MFFNCNWCKSSCWCKQQKCCKDYCHKERDIYGDKNKGYDFSQEKKSCDLDRKDYGYNQNNYGNDKCFDRHEKEDFGKFNNYDQDYSQNYEIDSRQGFNYYDQYGSFNKFDNYDSYGYEKDCKHEDKHDCYKPCKPSYNEKKCYCKPYKYVCFPIDKD